MQGRNLKTSALGRQRNMGPTLSGEASATVANARFRLADPRLADRVHHFPESVIRDMTRVALRDGAINLAQGFPDFDPPRELLDAAKAAIDAGHNQYALTFGSPRLRAALAEKVQRDNKIPCDADANLVVTCGATAGYDTRNDVRYIWTYEISIIGSNGWTMEDQAEVMRMARDGELEPVLHAVRPLAETADAIQELIDRKVFGKVVLVP